MSESMSVFTGVVMTGRRIKFWAYLGWNGEEQTLRKFKIRPSIVRNDQDEDSVTKAIRTVIGNWESKDLDMAIPEFTIERMAMLLSMEIRIALPTGAVLVALELNHGPTRVTVMPSINP